MDAYLELRRDTLDSSHAMPRSLVAGSHSRGTLEACNNSQSCQEGTSPNSAVFRKPDQKRQIPKLPETPCRLCYCFRTCMTHRIKVYASFEIPRQNKATQTSSIPCHAQHAQQNVLLKDFSHSIAGSDRGISGLFKPQQSGVPDKTSSASFEGAPEATLRVDRTGHRLSRVPTSASGAMPDPTVL